MKRKSFLTSLIIVLLAALPSAALAGSAVLHWQSNSDSDLGGYRIYYGTQSRHYGPYIPVDKAVSEYTLNGLVDGRTYYFALTAVDTSGNESGFSAEVSKTIVSGSTDIPIPLPASGAYGNITGGDQSHVNEVMFNFAGSPGNLAVSYQAWDVDNNQEVKIVLNGQVLGFAPKTGNNQWGATQTLILPDAYVIDSGTNVLEFKETHSSWGWGVRNVAMVNLTSSYIPLPASGAYGNITGGDQSHVNGAMFSFAGSPGNLEVGYEAWDVDNGQEVQIVLNGHVLGYAPVTGNGKWGTTQTLILPDEYVSDSGTNILKFSNTHNPPNKWEWGVRNVSLVNLADVYIPLPASGSYGQIKGGDQAHVNEALFSFAGSPGNLEVGYEAWDVDNGQEVQIVLNGHVLGYAPVTGNEKWGTTQTLILPDEYVSDSGTNILKFSNTHNPPNKWEWGVRNIQIK